MLVIQVGFGYDQTWPKSTHIIIYAFAVLGRYRYQQSAQHFILTEPRNSPKCSGLFVSINWSLLENWNPIFIPSEVTLAPISFVYRWLLTRQYIVLIAFPVLHLSSPVRWCARELLPTCQGFFPLIQFCAEACPGFWVSSLWEFVRSEYFSLMARTIRASRKAIRRCKTESH